MLFSRFFKVALPAALLLAAPTGAAAQNALASNVANAPVFNGISIAQLQAIFANTKFNEELFVVAPRRTNNGAPYLAVTAPSLPFTIYIAGASEEFSGDGDGVYAGAVMFTTMKLPSFSSADVHDFNHSHKFVKLMPVQSDMIYAVELLAAGGVTEAAIVTGLIPFFNGMTDILQAAMSQTVSYDGAQHLASASGRSITAPVAAFAGAGKLSNVASDPNADRLIASFADSAK